MEKNRPYLEMESLEEIRGMKGTLRHMAFQSLDFNDIDYSWIRFRDCYFLGCDIPEGMKLNIAPDCLVLPDLGKSYKVFRNCMYTPETLYEGYDHKKPETLAKCYDSVVYQDYISNGIISSDIRETLARTIHDFSVSDALGDYVSCINPHNAIGIMGGHAMRRSDKEYMTVVRISKTLTEKGKLMISGGGPGAMEATHLGAWMAGRTDEELDEAMKILLRADTFRDKGWLESAFEVRERFPQNCYESLGIPTWLYGHEPSTPFATHIAKFFENSIRENQIISNSLGGIIFSPGSAGTVREIFQDAEINHYNTLGSTGPMIFLGKEFYTKEIPIYTFLDSLLKTDRYKNLKLYLTDEAEEVTQFILC